MFSNKALRSLIIPLIIEQFLVISLGIFDTVMVTSVGESAMSGVSLVDMLNVLVIDIFSGLATGGAVVAAHYLGAGNDRGASRSGTQLILLAAFLGAAVAVIVIVFASPILRLLFGTVEADVMASALTYLKITALSFPFISVSNAAAALFRSMGNSRISMYSSLIINIINVLGNSVFIFVFHWGVAGAALSTVISRMISMLWLFIKLCRKDQRISVSVRHMMPDFSVMKKILYIGVPSGFESSMFQLGRVIVVTLIATFGTAQIAANAMANNLDAFGCIPGKGIQLAAITVVGQCVGAGLTDEAKAYTKKLLKITYILTAAVNLTVMATLPLTLGFYNVSDEAKRLGAILVLIHTGFAMLLWPLSFVMPNALRAGGDVKFTLAVSVFSMWVFRIVFSYIFGGTMGLGAIGVWIAMVMDWLFRSVMFLCRFHSGKWLHESLAKKR